MFRNKNKLAYIGYLQSIEVFLKNYLTDNNETKLDDLYFSSNFAPKEYITMFEFKTTDGTIIDRRFLCKRKIK